MQVRKKGIDTKSGTVSMKKRKSIVKILQSKFPELEFKIGGQISIDIFPLGKDKSYALKYLEKSKSIKVEDMVYFGDKCSEAR